jgi:hypothetical protein
MAERRIAAVVAVVVAAIDEFPLARRRVLHRVASTMADPAVGPAASKDFVVMSGSPEAEAVRRTFHI